MSKKHKNRSKIRPEAVDNNSVSLQQEETEQNSLTELETSDENTQVEQTENVVEPLPEESAQDVQNADFIEDAQTLDTQETESVLETEEQVTDSETAWQLSESEGQVEDLPQEQTTDPVVFEEGEISGDSVTQDEQPDNGQVSEADKIKQEGEEAAEKARKKAEKKALAREKRKQNNAKFKEWVKRHKLFVSLFIIIATLIIGAGVTTLVLTRNMYFVYNANNIAKMIEKNKRTDMKLEKDVTYDGDLTLNGYTLDLNKRTLTVNGDLTLNNDNASVIGRKRLFKKNYELGGKLVVNGNVVFNGVDYDLYSEIVAQTITVKNGNVVVYSEIKGEESVTLKYLSESEKNTLTINGKVNGNVELNETSSLILNGTAKDVKGGAVVRINDNASVGFISGAKALYLEPNSRWGGFDSDSVKDFYFVQVLSTPALLVNEENGVYTCFISHVDNADAYLITYGDLQEVRLAKNSSGTNTAYVLPDLAPGKYTLKVVAVSDNAEKYKSSATASTYVEVYITLSTPDVELCKEIEKEDGTHVILTFKGVEHALKYEINIEGKSVTVDANDAKTIEYDITEYVKNVGTYTIYIKATAPNTNYKSSANAMLSYVRVKKLTLTVSETVSDGFVVGWEKLAGAYAYEVRLYNDSTQLKSIVLSKDTTSIAIMDKNGVVDPIFGQVDAVNGYAVIPLGTGYYKDGDVKINRFTYPEPKQVDPDTDEENQEQQQSEDQEQQSESSENVTE